ncbi:integrase_H2C2 domain-containing protein [Trichonephila clavata]|uniref:Integrase_H2C2 domain-containing protein n=1 Tax=Trichonephila clavata TaxID=2740835 RepID=A0A8X6G2G7_TRICU|nr:integrase_H2C2 domain-containing protein [Trichonephila clavata]
MVDMSFQKPCGSSKVINPSTFGTNGSIACCEIGERSFTCPPSGKISTTNYFWTDSTIALSWIQGPSGRWKIFVANRVKEIRSLTDKDSWHHCPGKDNPSDLLTRGISADSLINCDKWWNGPSFFHEENTVPVSYNVLPNDESTYLEELRPSERKTLTVTLDNTFLNNILSVYNNFQKFLYVFSYIYRFINNCKKPSNKQIGPIRICEIQRAEITLVKLVQQLEFNSEIKDLSIKCMVNPQSASNQSIPSDSHQKQKTRC